MLQPRTSASAGHGLPPADADAEGERWRVCVPPLPHEVLHALQAVNTDTTQSRGHACTLQSRSSSSGHGSPPCWLAVTIRYCCVCEPLPHDFEHSVQPSTLTLQCTGHGFTSQSPAWTRDGHATPPCFAATSTDRERAFVPRPHACEHAPHAPQADAMQSTAHGWVLQDFESEWKKPPLLLSKTTAGQGAPPNAAATCTLR